MAASESDLKRLLKRVVELVMPDLRHYYRLPRKGRVVKSYASSDGQYWADVQPLRNDESDDPHEPVIPRVEIPILWGGPDRGVVCPPAVGALCDITFYDGDPNYPRLSNFRWAGNKAPVCELGAFIIQQRPGVYVKISAAGNIISTTDVDLVEDIGGDKNVAIAGDHNASIGGNKSEETGGNWSIEVGGSASVIATVAATIQAPQINLVGNLSGTGAGGGTGTETKSCNTTQTGSFTLTGDFHVNGKISSTSDMSSSGNISATGSILDGTTNSNHHSHP